MPSGLNLRLREDHQRPLVRLEFRIQWEPSELPPGREGLDGVLQRMLAVSGTDGLSREAFLRSLDEQGLRQDFRVEGRDLIWTCLATSHAQDAAFRNLVRVVARPKFETTTFAAIKQAYLDEISPLRQQALNLYRRGIGEPEGLSVPTRKSLAGLELADLERFRRRIIRPEKALLTVYGDMNLEQLQQMAALELGAWGPGPEPALAADPGAQPSGALESLLLFVGETGLPEARVASLRSGDAKDQAAWALILQALGTEAAGGLLSRDVELHATRDGLWWCRVTGGNAGTLMDRLQGFLDSLRQRTWVQGDVRKLQAAWKAERAARRLHPEAEVRNLAFQVQDDSLEAVMGKLKAEDLRKALQARLESSALHWLVLGATADEASRMAKTWTGTVKVMPPPQSAAPDPGNGPVRRR